MTSTLLAPGPFTADVPAGFTRGLPMGEYLSWRRVSASVVGETRPDRSDAWVRDYIENGSGAEDTAARVLGSLTHCALLEPDLLTSQFIIEPVADPVEFCNADGKPSSSPRSTKKWKDCIAALEATGKTVVPLETHRNAMAMRDAAFRHKRVRQLLDPNAGPVEITAAHELDVEGVPVPVKIRPDKLHEKLGSNVQIKTSRNAHVEAFMWDAWKMGHFIGAGFYERVLHGLGWGVKRTHFVVIQNDGYPEVAVYEPDLGMASAAEDLVWHRLKRIARCVESGVWPGLPADIQPLALPHPAFQRIEEEIATA